MIREAGHNIAMIVTGMGSVEEIMKRAHLMTLAPELFELADAGLEWMANLEAVLKEPSDVEAYRRYRARALEILAMASGKQVP
jgi:coenzyme F420-reducing hydrogenase alpha subunit